MFRWFDQVEIVLDRVPIGAVASESGAGVAVDIDDGDHLEPRAFESQRLPADTCAQFDRRQARPQHPTLPLDFNAPTVTCPWNQL